ncbi:MAG: threonine synthase, partial [Desulfobulbaceae bacterium]|nr:threonine synthase [Desulfobulbaceae bacterium]
SQEQMEQWANLGYTDLAFELLRLYVDESIIPAADLKRLIKQSFSAFESQDIIPVVPFGKNNDTFIMELFHGPTLSFKDIAMGFLVNCIDYFLQNRNEHLSIILATTGDTGPAAAYATAGKKTIDCWPLYPAGMISEEQARQMTTLNADNIYPLSVENCADGGDDLDRVITKLFDDAELKKRLQLSSVNSVNWCRVMVQSIHYFYGYFRVVDKIGDKVTFSIPSGAFGNLFGGYLARAMGLPVEKFICANNKNAALHTAFSKGVFAKKDLLETLSSAIDIVVPYNFWRFLYFISGRDSAQLTSWMDDFFDKGQIEFDEKTFTDIQGGFLSISISDQKTAETIYQTFHNGSEYLLDPHSAVAVTAAEELKVRLPESGKIICMATAHPAKFPHVMRQVLRINGGDLPEQATHPSLAKAGKVSQHLRTCKFENLEFALVDAMTMVSNSKSALMTSS